MKKQNGITLVSLIIYVVVMTIVLGVMSQIINNFYSNTSAVQGNVQEIVEFNKFNSYFLKEVKARNNKVDKVKNEPTNNYILFSSGNSFSLSNNAIYYNNIKICDGVQSMQIELGKNGDEIDKTIIYVTLNFGNFNKSINYKIENIY